MKKLLFTSILCCAVLSGMGQFVPQPLNYPGPGYWPYYYSITDPDHLWVGTFNENWTGCPFSVKTTDGGYSWVFDSIPVSGNPSCVSVCGWDAYTAYFVFYDMDGILGPSVWKTMDGGINWWNLITDQFTGSFINFYHAFSADTGLAMGDPRDGYFEIQLTTNGGSAWTRVPSSSIPSPLADEIGLNHSYSAVGNSIWFTTSKSRIFRSTDKGQNWEASVIPSTTTYDLGLCFATGLNGVLWFRGATSNQLLITQDGGISWTPASFPAGFMIQDISRVSDFEEGFVVTAYKNTMRVYFTPDLFSTLQVIQSGILSNGAIEFYNASTGWLGGGESGVNEIFKYSGLLTSALEAVKKPGRLSILPNPAAADALVKLPVDAGIRFPALRITDLSGKVITRMEIPFATGWTSLNAALFPDGIYLVEYLSDDVPLAREKWVVRH